MDIYVVAWVVAVLGATALGEASRVVGWWAAGLIVVLAALGFLGGFVGVMAAQAVAQTR